MAKKHCIIGVSAAGMSMANHLRRLDPDSEIICISAEQEFPYNKCFLADHLSGAKSQEQVYTITPELCAQKKITLLLGVWVSAIDCQNKKIFLNGYEPIFYDTLFIGTGSSAIIPQIKGVDRVKSGSFTFHTIADSQALLSLVQQKKGLQVVIVGAGLSGLECADSLAIHGAQVTVVEKQAQILNRQVDREGAVRIAQAMKAKGITLHVEQTVQEIFTDDQGAVSGVVLGSGQQIPVDCIIFALGLQPNIGIVKNTSIQLCMGGIETDQFMQTTVPSIYAGGDVACVVDQLTGSKVLSCTWPDAMFQGMVAAHSAVGISRSYPGVALITSSSFFGFSFACAGKMYADSSELTQVVRDDATTYRSVILHNNRLVGFVSLGSSTNLTMLKRALLGAIPVDVDQLLS